MTLPIPPATELLPLTPELVLVGATFALLMLDLFVDESKRVITHLAAILILLVTAGLIVAGVGGQGAVLNGMFVRDDAGGHHEDRDLHDQRGVAGLRVVVTCAIAACTRAKCRC